jgi:gluconokinase
MGVAGSGKTTIGRLLAERLGVGYAEADEFHPAANIARMRAGQPLDDTARQPWLEAIAAWIRQRSSTGDGGVVSCSALTVRYRDVLRGSGAPIWFLHLDTDRGRIVGRVAARPGHFMPASLVDSQFDTLEPLGPTETGTMVDAADPPEVIVRTAVARMPAP